jgi:GDP-4-dehydro-6-deoxy-D-mannose reductase
VNALVTGGSGFVGQWLIRSLLQSGWQVTASRHEDPEATHILDPPERAAVDWVDLDVRRTEHIDQALARSRPDVVFHLAAVASVPVAAADPGLTLDVNAGGAARLLFAISQRRRQGEVDPTILIVGSSEQYGCYDASDMPLTEQAAQRPISAYAASKAAQETIALQAARSEGTRVVCTRSFGHSGPGQSQRYLLPSLVARALVARREPEGRLRVGNLTPVRDLLHVADVVEAYRLLAQRGTSGEVYNVCSGIGWSVSALATLVMRAVGMDSDVETDDALVRPVDVPVLVGDSSKLRAATGWNPTRTVEDIVTELVSAAA